MKSFKDILTITEAAVPPNSEKFIGYLEKNFINKKVESKLLTPGSKSDIDGKLKLNGTTINIEGKGGSVQIDLKKFDKVNKVTDNMFVISSGKIQFRATK